MKVPVWNPAVEFLEREALERLQLANLRKTVAWALKTPFYRRRLAEVGLHHPEDIASLRDLRTGTDAGMTDRVHARAGIRLPLDFDVQGYARDLARWAAGRVGADLPQDFDCEIGDGSSETVVSLAGEQTSITLRFLGHEAAWRSDRNNGLVRSFLSAIRAQLPDARPGFVVKTGTSDMNVVGPAWQCPILAYGPGDSALDHTPNEHVQLSEYASAVAVLEAALRGLAASG